MSSTFDQFVNTFKQEISKVAEIEGDNDQTLSIIISAFESSRLKELLDELDRLRESCTNSRPENEEPSRKPTVSKTRKTGGAVSTTNQVAEEGDDKKPAKQRRVTGYNEFVKEQVAGKKSSMQEAAAVWKSMDDVAKKPYNDRAKAKNETTVA